MATLMPKSTVSYTASRTVSYTASSTVSYTAKQYCIIYCQAYCILYCHTVLYPILPSCTVWYTAKQYCILYCQPCEPYCTIAANTTANHTASDYHIWHGSIGAVLIQILCNVLYPILRVYCMPYCA